MICFKKIRWRNLLSTGNQWTEIDLNKKSNTVIIGTNGAGKSTMLDALTFVLFNKPFRKINKSQLVNATNEKDCMVELDFTEGEEFEADESEDTISLLNRYIQESEVDLDKSGITEILQDVYREACEVE